MIICHSIDKCTGCALCLNSCHKNAISFTTDKEGFSYPIINDKLCVKCLRCVNVCPQNQHALQTTGVESEPSFYYAHATDAKTRKTGSSGGIFGAIANELLKKGYVIYGASFDENFNLSHIRISAKNNLEKLYCSKYIQSDITNTHKLVLKDINDGIKVLFVGTPCQVDAIKRFIGKTDLLVTIDLVCYGVGSTAFFNDFLHSLEQKYNSKAIDIVFRKKIYGSHNGYMNITFKNSKKYKRIFFQTEFGIAFSKRLINRPSCYDCKYSSYHRCGDLTIGDYRPSKKKINPFELRKGVSLIRPNSSIGNNLIDSLIKNNIIKTQKVKYDELKGMPMRQSPELVPSECRNEAMDIYVKKGYKSFCETFCKQNKKTYRELKLSFFKEIIKWVTRK